MLPGQRLYRHARTWSTSYRYRIIVIAADDDIMPQTKEAISCLLRRSNYICYKQG
jgi:translation elongation factor EF-Tu-like GTPase